MPFPEGLKHFFYLLLSAYFAFSVGYHFEIYVNTKDTKYITWGVFMSWFAIVFLVLFFR